MHPHLKIHHPNWHPQENPRTEEAWRLNYALTPRGGPSRSELRHIGRAVWRILHCCYPCWTCSMDKFRTLVSSAVKLASFTSTKFTFKRKKKKEIKFWLYITNLHWLIRLTGQQSTLFCPWCCKGKEAAAGWLARPQRCACYTGTTSSFPVRPSPTPPWQGPRKTTDGLGNRASSSAPLLSVNSRDCHCKKKINNRTFPLLAIHHFRASLGVAATSQTRRRSRPCLPR